MTFERVNDRTAAPEEVGGWLQVASFNVLNYFNGDGLGGGFPTERGANTPLEFERQRTKIINAIVALDADIIGLMEIENDGSGPTSAIADLVDGLNDATAPGTYALIADPATGVAKPTEPIKTALIYRPAAVTPIGALTKRHGRELRALSRRPDLLAEREWRGRHGPRQPLQVQGL